VEVAKLPDRGQQDYVDRVMLVAHLPEDAKLWVQDQPTTSTGDLRYFQSPRLQPGKQLWYTLRLQWNEDGELVTQTQEVPVEAGDVHCIHIIQSDSDPAKKDLEYRITDNLAFVSAEDRKLIDAQRFCAVQEGNRLGSMGLPVKVMLKGQPVFLCCEGCRHHAESDPDKTLETVQKLKAKASALPPAKAEGVATTQVARIAENLAKLSAEDRALAEAQKFCAALGDSRLGSMGVPVKLMVKGDPVFICCASCANEVQNNPDLTLAKVQKLKAENAPSPAKSRAAAVAVIGDGPVGGSARGLARFPLPIWRVPCQGLIEAGNSNHAQELLDPVTWCRRGRRPPGDRGVDVPARDYSTGRKW
jgi:uncharacterized protein (TIGR03000 family)